MAYRSSFLVVDSVAAVIRPWGVYGVLDRQLCSRWGLTHRKMNVGQAFALLVLPSMYFPPRRFAEREYLVDNNACDTGIAVKYARPIVAPTGAERSDRQCLGRATKLFRPARLQCG